MLELKVLSKTKIIKLRNSRVYGFDHDSPNAGGSFPINVHLQDNFGNVFGIKEVSPEYYGHRTEKGVKPNESKEFKLTVNDTPLDSTEYLILLLDKDFFDSPNPIRIKIPYSTINIK